MIFSKSFGYALRGVLYLGMAGESKSMVQLDEIARELTIPRHFLGKVMNKLVKEGVLSSQKGPSGGFCINEKTMETSLLNLVKITGEPEEFSSCVLRLRKCTSDNPCPVHHQIESLRQQWQTLLTSTTIGNLIRKDMPDFIKSIAVI
jgi:Rrf2 family protein